MLAGQVVALCELFPPEEVHQHLSPIGMRLWGDSVATVRTAAAGIPGALYTRFRGFPQWENEVLQALHLAGKSRGWLARQIFGTTCRSLVQTMPVPLPPNFPPCVCFRAGVILVCLGGGCVPG